MANKKTALMFHRHFLSSFSVIRLIFSVSYLEILGFLSVIVKFIGNIKMSEILFFCSVNFTDGSIIWYSYLCKSLRILSMWCFLYKMHDYVEIVHSFAPFYWNFLCSGYISSKIYKIIYMCLASPRP